jgi:hypothetical protein
VPDRSSYDANATLRVLLGARNGANNDYRAFFFLNERYLGTDTLEPSASPLAVVSVEDTLVALRYALYRPADPDCCPAAGSVVVQFQWNGERLVPLDTIPATDRSAPTSRR